MSDPIGYGIVQIPTQGGVIFTAMPSSPASSAASTGGSAPIVWLNGALLDASEAGISPFDHGLLTGDGVFETLAGLGGEPFAASRHHQRLVRSAAALGLIPPPAEELLTAMREVMHANGCLDARIRVTVTGGISPLGSDRGQARHTALVAVSAMPTFKPLANVVTVPFTRNEKGALVGLKTISYAENVLALNHAKQQGGDEPIFGNTQGILCEGASTNVFLVRDGTVLTPPLSTGCLAGVTRGLAIELCAELGIPCEEVLLPLDALEQEEEIFLSSTLRCLQAVGRVNAIDLSKAPGETTCRLVEAFAALQQRNLDP